MRDSTGTWLCNQLLCYLTRAATAYLGCLCSSGNGCLWARAGKLQVKSILSTKRIRQIPSKYVLIRDVTGLDTSKDRKPSWAIPPIKFQSYRWLLRCSAVHSTRGISRFTFFSSPKVIGCYFILFFSRFDLTWVPVHSDSPRETGPKKRVGKAGRKSSIGIP